MRYIADFHLHSKYSRATSPNMELDTISQWANWKGIDIVGTGDFTHPFWFSGMKQKFEEAAPGLFKLKDNPKSPFFILTAELSSIYSQGGRVRKIHNLIFAPSLETVTKINDQLTGRANLHSDGRPIMGIPAKDLAEMILDIDKDCLFIPAHAWTPWFSVFGSNSGFDSLEECFGDLTKYIPAIETGLSSDPEMNWRVSAIDKLSLISCSDAHSPANLGREATVFELDKPSYPAIAEALKAKDSKKLLYTIEFYPEEGKYHFDGHRNCDIRIDPTKEPKQICPACGKPLTIGVMNRVNQLADRQLGYQPKNFPLSRHLVPLQEIIAESLEVSPKSQKAIKEYQAMISHFGSEFKILLDMPAEELSWSNQKIIDGIRRAKEGNLVIEPGYDGVYGKVKVFEGKESSPVMNLQASLFDI